MFDVDDGDEPIVTPRLTLTLLTVEDADEMVDVLGDERLHDFIGGRPLDLDELRHRYRSLVAGPAEPAERWLNWIVRTREGVAVGTMQATVSTTRSGRSTADVAWVTGVRWQGLGYASEAARALLDWLYSHGVDDVAAYIHPDHHASATVATRARLRPTGDEHDGETVWRRRGGGPANA